jgi:hypothetical protein
MSAAPECRVENAPERPGNNVFGMIDADVENLMRSLSHWPVLASAPPPSAAPAWLTAGFDGRDSAGAGAIVAGAEPDDAMTRSPRVSRSAGLVGPGAPLCSACDESALIGAFSTGSRMSENRDRQGDRPGAAAHRGARRARNARRSTRPPALPGLGRMAIANPLDRGAGREWRNRASAIAIRPRRSRTQLRTAAPGAPGCLGTPHLPLTSCFTTSQGGHMGIGASTPFARTLAAMPLT